MAEKHEQLGITFDTDTDRPAGMYVSHRLQSVLVHVVRPESDELFLKGIFTSELERRIDQMLVAHDAPVVVMTTFKRSHRGGMYDRPLIVLDLTTGTPRDLKILPRDGIAETWISELLTISADGQTVWAVQANETSHGPQSATVDYSICTIRIADGNVDTLTSLPLVWA